MTANDLKSRYGIKLPHELGKPLYIQDVDVWKEFKRRVGEKIFRILFSLFGSGIAILMFYGAFAYDHPEYFLFGLLFSINFVLLYRIVREFLDIELLAVGDKGIIQYILNPKGTVIREESILFSHTLSCEQHEGEIDPHSPISSWRGYKYEAKWVESSEEVFKIVYFPNDLKNKQAQEAAIQAFEVYRITGKHHG